MIILLVIWTLFVTALLVSRIKAVAGASIPQDLALFTVFDKLNFSRIRTFVGGVHRLEVGLDYPSPPWIYIYLPCNELPPNLEQETGAWDRVIVQCTAMDKESLLTELLKHHRSAVCIDSNYVLDPVPLVIKRAELLDETDAMRRALELGKSKITALTGQNYTISRNGVTILEAKTKEIKGNHFDDSVLVPWEKASPSLACFVVLKKEAIMTGATLAYPSQPLEIKKGKQLVALGIPTTSKGMTPGEEAVFIKTLLPSLVKTVSTDEMNRFQIVLFIGFDAGDPFYDHNDPLLKRIYKQIRSAGFDAFFLRLLPLYRVAMTWNMIFAAARKMGPFEFFYQLNDDLTMISAGWLTRFTATLDAADGFGVVGPSDTFNDFSCSLLTQAMVSDRHFRLFHGLLYPLEFRDWKSDRWLSFVYGDDGTHCWPKLEANNGAKGTRYTACPFELWRLVLEREKRRISNQ